MTENHIVPAYEIIQMNENTRRIEDGFHVRFFLLTGDPIQDGTIFMFGAQRSMSAPPDS